MENAPIKQARWRQATAKALRWAKRAFTPVALGFIFWMAWKNRDVLAGMASGARPGMLVLALLLWAANHAMAPVYYRAMLRVGRSRVPFGAALKIHTGRLPARYIPGGIWHTVGRVADFHSLGVSPRRLALFVFLENAMGAATAFFIGGGLLFYFRHGQGWGVAGGLGSVAGAAGLVLIPSIARRFILKNEGTLNLRSYAVLLGVGLAFWTLASAAFCVYVWAFPGLRAHISLLETAGAYMFGWAVGNVTVFAPQGIGVFEAVAADMLKGPMALGGTAALLAGFRAVALVSDFLTWALVRGAFELASLRARKSRKDG